LSQKWRILSNEDAEDKSQRGSDNRMGKLFWKRRKDNRLLWGNQIKIGREVWVGVMKIEMREGGRGVKGGPRKVLLPSGGRRELGDHIASENS